MDEQEFIQLYGETTSDGVPRFGDDYSFLKHPAELSISDAYKLGGVDEASLCIEKKAEKFCCDLGDKICDLLNW